MSDRDTTLCAREVVRVVNRAPDILDGQAACGRCGAHFPVRAQARVDATGAEYAVSVIPPHVAPRQGVLAGFGDGANGSAT